MTIQSFQQSYWRAGAAVFLSLMAFIVPIAGAPKWPPDGKTLGGLLLIGMLLISGIRELIIALHLRKWSDIFVFGICPAASFVGSSIYVHVAHAAK